jgi:hypothetical protein
MDDHPRPRRRAAPRRSSPPPGKTPPSASAVRITERDRLLLAFAAEHRFVLCSHVGSLLGISPAAADARLVTLCTGGYLQGESKLLGEPAAYRITRAGLRAADSDLSPPHKLDLATYQHESGIAWLMLAARHERFGPLQQIVSERRMRSLDARADRPGEPFGVRLGGVGPGGRERLHYPDLLVVTASGHRVAFELELTSKARNRREGILGGYASEPRIDAVVYLVDRPNVGQAVSRSAARLRASGLVHVQNVRWGGAEGQTPPQVAPQRLRERGAGSRTSQDERTPRCAR